MLKLPALINYSVSLCGDPRLWVAWSTVDNFRKELYKNRTSHCAQKMGTVFLWIVRELKRIRSNFTWIQFISRRLYCQISWMYIRNGSFSHRNSASNVSFGVIEVRCPFKWIDHLQIFIKSNYIVVFFFGLFGSYLIRFTTGSIKSIQFSSAAFASRTLGEFPIESAKVPRHFSPIQSNWYKYCTRTVN